MYQTIITVALGLLSAGLVYYQIRSRRKSVKCQVRTDEGLVDIKEDAKGKIKIYYDGAEIANPRLLTFRIVNGGSPVAVKDFERPLLIDLGSGAKIYSAEISDTVPQNLDPGISYDKNRIVIEPLLLNRGDSMTIKAIGSSFSEPTLKTRILGVREIKTESEAEALKYFVSWRFYSKIFSFVTGVLAVSAFVAFQVVDIMEVFDLVLSRTEPARAIGYSLSDEPIADGFFNADPVGPGEAAVIVRLHASNIDRIEAIYSSSGLDHKAKFLTSRLSPTSARYQPGIDSECMVK